MPHNTGSSFVFFSFLLFLPPIQADRKWKWICLFLAIISFFSLSKKRRHPLESAEFPWNQSTIIKKEVGSGTFGSVYFAEFNNAKEQRSIVIKKLKGESAESRRHSKKEASILKSVKGHRNIFRFFRSCQEPHSIMIEYSCFDFGSLGVEKRCPRLKTVHLICWCWIRLFVVCRGCVAGVCKGRGNWAGVSTQKQTSPQRLSLEAFSFATNATIKMILRHHMPNAPLCSSSRLWPQQITRHPELLVSGDKNETYVPWYSCFYGARNSARRIKKYWPGRFRKGRYLVAGASYVLAD